MTVLEALVAIQGALKAPKDQNAGRYRYRNIEDINQAVKPLAAEHGCAVVYTDSFEGGVCISTCTLIGKDGELSADGCAYVNTSPKNMSVEQSSGAASSYARKYAACGLFAIDSSENDPDRTNAEKPKDDRLTAAKKEAWIQIVRYAELLGKDPKPMAEGIKKRPAFEDTADFWDAVAEEFRSACEERGE